MSQAIPLLRAILGDLCPSDSAAMTVLEIALEREIEPLRYCALTLGIGEVQVMERAARHLGMHFYEQIPRSLEAVIVPNHIDALADVRIVSVPAAGDRVVFSSPDFFGLVRLKERLTHNRRLLRKHCLVPERALRHYLARSAAAALTDEARQRLARRWPFATAQLELTVPARRIFVSAVCLLVALTLMAPYLGHAWLFPVILLVVVAPAMIRLAALLHGVSRTREHHGMRPDDDELPIYSVLIPLRDEAHMVPQLARAMQALRYPPEKLDVIFVVEDRSEATLRAVEALLPTDSRFSLVAVPDSMPRTKPKALNVALPLCRGEFVVVYDAEDTPHPDQLWRVAERFAIRPDLQCVQAHLVIDNGGERALSALFAGEYAGLFGVVLPALAKWGLPMPLGGTSNHFRTATLRAIGGWDGFNVTEDADLGVRLARLRYPVEVIDCPTFEEAPTRIQTWLGQRSRWMKGWMQTFIVHSRDPRALARDSGLVPMIAFQIWAMGSIVAPLLHVGFIATLLVSLLLGIRLFNGWLDWSTVYLGVFLFGYGTAVALTIVGLQRRGEHHLMLPQLLLPVYWVLMVPATLRALWELTNSPFYWAKTRHSPVSVRRRARSPQTYDKGGRRKQPHPVLNPSQQG